MANLRRPAYDARMRASAIVYAGLLVALFGVILLVRPLRSGWWRGRRAAGIVLTVGIVTFVAAANWPAADTVVARESTLLDHFVPRYQFREVHSIRIAASREQTYRAIREVTADDIFLFRTLTWIRRLGQPLPEGILNAPEREPILDVAMRTSFRKLAEDPGREIVVGTAVLAPAGWKPRDEFDPEDFRRAQAPGFAVAAMNFRVEEVAPNVSIVTTETRVYATDPSSRQKFARYWRVIYPGSALIRRMWLRAVRGCAQGGGPQR